MEIISY